MVSALEIFFEELFLMIPIKYLKYIPSNFSTLGCSFFLTEKMVGIYLVCIGRTYLVCSSSNSLLCLALLLRAISSSIFIENRRRVCCSLISLRRLFLPITDITISSTHFLCRRCILSTCGRAWQPVKNINETITKGSFRCFLNF